MIIALPERDHEHLADALVRDLGFTRTHVDAPLRDLLLALDPFVDSGVTLANMGPSPRLSSKLDQVGGASPEARWDRLLHPPRPGAASDRTATEVGRLLDVLRWSASVKTTLHLVDTVIVGGRGPNPVDASLVAISGRFDGDTVDHWIEPAGVVGEQEAIVAYVKELRESPIGPDATPQFRQIDADYHSAGDGETDPPSDVSVATEEAMAIWESVRRGDLYRVERAEALAAERRIAAEQLAELKASKTPENPTDGRQSATFVGVTDHPGVAQSPGFVSGTSMSCGCAPADGVTCERHAQGPGGVTGQMMALWAAEKSKADTPENPPA